MATKATGWTGRVRPLAMDALGMLALMSLPAMWVSWTEAMLLAVAGIGVITGTLWCLLGRVEGSEDSGRRTGTVNVLNDQMLAELSNLGPMIYHNRLSAEPRLENALNRVKRALKENE